VLRYAIGAELRDADQSVKDALRNRVRQVHAYMRPLTTP
jgi:hypothetical protein